MPLRLQLLLLQALIVCLTTTAAGFIAGTFQERAIRDAYRDRMQAVALSISRLPAIIDAFDSERPSDVIQPIAEVVREASELTYVVVANADGIRYSHPDVERIGERVSTDPSVPLSGQIYVGTQTGTLGTTWRVKVPIFGDGDEVIGTVSVGILESQLSAEFQGNLLWLVAAMIASAIAGLFGAAWVTATIRRRIYRLEPREIASLVENRETTLHRLTEGVLTVDDQGVIAMVNDAAERLLDRPAASLVGRRAADELEEELLEVLQRGEPDGRPVVVGERVVIARSTGTEAGGRPVEATLLLRDHTELHEMLQRVEAADAILAFRGRAGLPKGLSAETLETVARALAASPGISAAELGDSIGLSRVSARRYLEHLASIGRATRALDYTTKGRPGTRYRPLPAEPAGRSGAAATASDASGVGAR